MRILVVEDDKKVAGFIKKGLEEETYAIDVAYDGEDGLHLGSEGQYDLIILDIMLPKIDGLEILSQLRDQGRDTPILLLTAKDAVDDRVTGLNKGADLFGLQFAFWHDILMSHLDVFEVNPED